VRDRYLKRRLRARLTSRGLASPKRAYINGTPNGRCGKMGGFDALEELSSLPSPYSYARSREIFLYSSGN
jgi:hypothetical protein